MMSTGTIMIDQLKPFKKRKYNRAIRECFYFGLVAFSLVVFVDFVVI